MSLDGVVYPYLVEETRLKPGVIRTTKGNVFTLPALRQMIKSGYLLTHHHYNTFLSNFSVQFEKLAHSTVAFVLMITALIARQDS